jgi:U6 snRNA-associated Sm-like protein LSm8
MATSLNDWRDKSVCVVTSDGRIIVGILTGYDQVQNLILNDAHERVYSVDADVEEVPLGLYVVRGDNVCLVAEVDETKQLDSQRVPFPLPSIQQQQF